MPNLGGPELIIILLIFVLLFGAAKLPALGRSMGQSITNFKKGVDEGKGEEDKAATEAEKLRLQAAELEAQAEQLQAKADQPSLNGSSAADRQHR